MGEVLFELFCIKNDFTKCFAKCRNLFKYLFRTLWQFLEIIHFYTTGQTKFPCVAQFYEMPFWHQSKSNRK